MRGSVRNTKPSTDGNELWRKDPGWSDASNQPGRSLSVAFRSMIMVTLLVLALTLAIFNSCWRDSSDVLRAPALQYIHGDKLTESATGGPALRASPATGLLLPLTSTTASVPGRNSASTWWSNTALTDPKVRVISMISRGDYQRLGSFMAHWDLHNVSYFPKPTLFHAVDVAGIPREEMWFSRSDQSNSYYYSSFGAYGCLLSHLHLMKEHEAENQNRHADELDKYSDLVIFEDDAAFIDGFEDILIKTLRDNKRALSDWDFFYLGGTVWRPPMVNASAMGYFKLETMGNTHAYMIRGKSIRRIVEYIESNRDILPIDIVYSNLMERKIMNGYSPGKILSGQLQDAGSVINARETNFAHGAQNTMTLGCGFMNMIGEFCDQCADKASIKGAACGACCGPYTYRVRHTVFNAALGSTSIVPGEVVRA